MRISGRLLRSSFIRSMILNNCFCQYLLDQNIISTWSKQPEIIIRYNNVKLNCTVHTLPQMHSKVVGNTAFPRQWCNKKFCGNFKCHNPFSWPPQSHPWNSMYLMEHKHHIFQIQYILVSVDTDCVKPLTHCCGLTYAWTYTELPENINSLPSPVNNWMPICREIFRKSVYGSCNKFYCAVRNISYNWINQDRIHTDHFHISWTESFL